MNRPPAPCVGRVMLTSVPAPWMVSILTAGTVTLAVELAPIERLPATAERIPRLDPPDPDLDPVPSTPTAAGAPALPPQPCGNTLFGRQRISGVSQIQPPP